MARILSGFGALLAALGFVAAVPAQAASLQPVSNWGATGVPSSVSMFIYTPDKLAANPPILVCSHYCGGTAADMFAEARGGGLVSAADQYGFIMIFPQAANSDGSGRCWDVGTTKSLTHDGGGDTQAIAEMVKYTIGKYNANKDRVYAAGTSSGAMMTEALLAIYPDVFKAGVEFSGVPAGCWAVGASADGTWSGPCAGGQVTHTAQEWGDIARNMYPGYSGYRPRVQLWHGDADQTISYTDHTEAIKQWTNVLGLKTDPTSTTTLTLASHQWTRQSWQSSCGYTVLEAWTEHNGGHNTDANLNSQYAIPFLGLDKTAATDPEIAQCGGEDGGGSGGDGGADSGGSSGAGDGGIVLTQDAGAADGGGSGPSGSPDAGGNASASGDGGTGGAQSDAGSKKPEDGVAGTFGCSVGGSEGVVPLFLFLAFLRLAVGRRRRAA